MPTLEEDDGFLLWESNSIVRYLAAKHGAGTLEPADLRTRARAQKWMDWQLSVLAPAITPVFWGLIRTPPEKRDPTAIEAGKEKTIAAAKMLDAQLGKTLFMAGESSPTATSRSASWSTATCSSCRSARRCRISSAGTRRSRRARRSRSTSRWCRCRKLFAEHGHPSGVTTRMDRVNRVGCVRAHPRVKHVATAPRPQQLRHVAGQAGGLADEQALERRQAIDQAEADVARRAAARRSGWRTAG